MSILKLKRSRAETWSKLWQKTTKKIFWSWLPGTATKTLSLPCSNLAVSETKSRRTSSFVAWTTSLTTSWMSTKSTISSTKFHSKWWSKTHLREMVLATNTWTNERYIGTTLATWVSSIQIVFSSRKRGVILLSGRISRSSMRTNLLSQLTQSSASLIRSLEDTHCSTILPKTEIS